MNKIELKEYKRNWMKKRREEFFSGKSCVKCGATSKLELDHVDPKEKTSHRIWSWTKDKRELELSKCQILCYDCHKFKSKLELSKPITHGLSGYDRGCRCNICRDTQINRMNEYHLKHPRKKKREHSSMVEP